MWKKNTRRITVNPCRGARIISYRNFSPFSAFVKSLKQSEEPPCNPESLGPESSCLAGRLESGFVSSGTIQQIDKLKKKKEEGVQNRQAIRIELFYWRCESGNAFWTSGAVCAGGLRQRVAGRHGDASRPRRGNHLIAVTNSGSCRRLLRLSAL